MSHFRMVMLAGLATALACSAGEPADTTEEDVAAINQVREMEAEGVGSGDVETGVAAFTDDVVFMAPNESIMNGKDAVRSWLATAYEQFTLDVDYTSSDITVAGDWAVERYAGTATFTPKTGGDALVEHIKGIHIYRRQADGTWKITQDIWNTDEAPPAM